MPVTGVQTCALPIFGAQLLERGVDYTEEEIRLVRIKFMCEQGN